jgi:hypothetical protein
MGMWNATNTKGEGRDLLDKRSECASGARDENVERNKYKGRRERSPRQDI